MSRFTHEGTIRGADARTPKGYQFRSALRQTKRYWVTTHGFKFRKEDGFTPGDWGLYRLDMDSVKPCTHNTAISAPKGADHGAVEPKGERNAHGN